MRNDIIAALATCSCEKGALGIVRISGRGSIDLTNKFVDIDLKKRNDHSVNLCRFIDENGEILDEVLVLLFFDGHSYTKEESVEISCHNSKYILNRVLEILIKNGARMAEHGEYTRRAFLNGRFDLIQAEAVADLIASKSKSAHDIAMNQMRGEYSKKIENIKKNIIEIASLLELGIDFSEEDVEFHNFNDLRMKVIDVRNEILKMINNFEKGNVIKKGLPIAIVGRPNVGKSSLLNALVGDDRAIVSKIAGTTRDSIDVEIVIGDIVCRFIDTAGLREKTDDVIEKIGIEKTKKNIEKASLILFMIDVEMTFEDYKKNLEEIKNLKKEILIIVNKIDLNNKYKCEEDAIYISTLKNIGIDRIKEYIANKYKIIEGEFIVNIRHLEVFTRMEKILKRIEEGLDKNISNELIMIDVNSCIFELNKIFGDKNNDETVLDNIFSSFCIGK